MDRIKDIYQSLTESQVKEAVLEIAERNETGYYKSDGVLRKIQHQIIEIINSERYSIEAVVHGVTWEISRRRYNELYGIAENIIEE